MTNRLLLETVASLARGVDRAFARAALEPRREQRRRLAAVDYPERVRRLGVLASFYGRSEFLARESALLPRPEPIAPQLQRLRGYADGGEILDLSWPSEFEPLWSSRALSEHLASLSAAERARLAVSDSDANSGDELSLRLGFDQSAPLRDKYLRASANRTARARWFRHGGAPRPCLVLLHGYMGGDFAIEQRVWPVRRLFDSGCDVVLSLLPLHGLRRSEQRGYRPPAFPSSDPRFTIEGFRQLVWDHRGLFDFLLAGRVSRLGMFGMSLGGYSTALLATLEASLQCAALLVPLAAIESLAQYGERELDHERQRSQQRELLRVAQWPVSPIARPSLIASERVVVVAGEADLVTGLAQGQQLAQHFGSQLSVFEGGHLLQIGRERALAPVRRLVDRFVAGGDA
jgi:pimeloyl-ACP methyl ester carboxylesterase